MPFGVGNRQCIGNRLALLEMKVMVAGAVKQFSVEKTSATPVREFISHVIIGVNPAHKFQISASLYRNVPDQKPHGSCLCEAYFCLAMFQ